MPPVPNGQKIYHILHADRLSSVLANGGLLSDELVRERECAGTMIGMGSLKERRLTRPVPPHHGSFVGQYVPFYFCSRSVMLYLIYRGNHPELGYTGGQGPIVHLEADLQAVVQWASANDRPWAFSLGNATAGYTEFSTGAGNLSQLRWNLIPVRDFRDPDVKEAKQSEFLVRDFFPWTLIERIGTLSQTLATQVAQLIADQEHRPTVQAVPGWYY